MWAFVFCWSIFMAVKVMPIYVDRKVGKPGGTVDRVITKAEDRIAAKVIAKIPPFPPIPGVPVDLPTMEDIRVMVSQERAKTTENLNLFQKNIPDLIIQTVQTPQFEAVFKSYEGRMYAAKGIELDKIKNLTADYTDGMEAAEKVYLDKIQDPEPDDRTELTLLLKDALRLAEDAGYIEEGSTKQKMGLVHGVLKIIDRLKDRNGGTATRGPNLASGGNELDNYYR